MPRIDFADTGANLLDTFSDGVISTIETRRRSFFIMQKHLLKAQAEILQGAIDVVNNEIEGVEKLEQSKIIVRRKPIETITVDDDDAAS